MNESKKNDDGSPNFCEADAQSSDTLPAYGLPHITYEVSSSPSIEQFDISTKIPNTQLLEQKVEELENHEDLLFLVQEESLLAWEFIDDPAGLYPPFS